MTGEGPALDRLIDALTAHGSAVRHTNGRIMAQCPAHEDRNPSLSIAGSEGQALVYCFAGCRVEDVLASLGMTAADLFDDKRGVTYRYDDGRTVHRTPDKRFRQSNAKGPAQLYRLSRLAEHPDAVVHLVEGEKDVHAVESGGGVATCNPMGSTNFGKVDVGPLRGRNVVAVVDRDAAGLKWAAQVRERLVGYARTVTFVEAAVGKDAADHIAAGYGLTDFVQHDSAPEDEPEPIPPTEYDQPADLFEGWDEMTEPPDGDTSLTADERQDVQPDEFWKARPILAHLHDFARARRVGPWAVLGTALARVITCVPPTVQIPPMVGSYASLNLFVGLVGNSGDGKDVAQKVARDALDVGDPPRFSTVPVGSGEGLAHMFMRIEKGNPDPVQYNHAAMVTIGEIDTLGALVQRQSATVTSQLRQAAMGEQLGFFYADHAKRMLVPEHQYRMSLIAGIQPARSSVLLGDSDGGTPQRFVWLPAGDPHAPDFPPDEPVPVLWRSPDWMQLERAHSGNTVRMLMRLPDIAVDTVKKARLDRLRGNGEALDGHSLLTRVKVACALAVLDGRVVVTDEDWQLSGTVMAVSDTQRARCQKALAAIREKENLGKALAEAERAVVVDERVSTEKLRKAAAKIRRKLAAAGAGGETEGKLRNALRSTERDFFDDAIKALAVAGEVRAEEVEYHGSRSLRYFLASPN